MLYKKALCEVVPLKNDLDESGKLGLIKTASGRIVIEPGSEKARLIEAEIKKHPTALFFRAKAIKADEANSNGDYFSEEELLKSYKTFEGVPFFTNHDNQNIENARGKVVFAEWIPEEKAVYTISFVDREAFPHICRSIEEEYTTGVSMGCSVEYSVCSICGNRAEKTDDYCSHIKNRKGRTFTGKAKNVVTGEMKEFKGAPVFEYNHGIKFIELSAVVDPACPSCHIEGVINNDDYIAKLANVQNSIYMIKTSAIQKRAGQEEVNKLNEVLKTLEDIAINLIQNRQQVEVEFASDLVNILSDLQKFVDEIVGAGYGSLQSVPGTMPTPQEGVGGQEAAPATGAAPVAGMPPATPPAGLPPVAEVGAETQAPVGSISGSPTKPMVSAPKLPITAPRKPLASDENKFTRLAELCSLAGSLRDKIQKMGDEDMGKRRTVAEKKEQKKAAIEVLSNSWKEKQAFFEYIKKVPSLQDNVNKISVKKSEDNFIIVAENKNEDAEGSGVKVWTYEDLNEEERRLIKESPREAALSLLNTFANSLNQQKEGVNIMSKDIKQAGASSVNKEPEVLTEAQLQSQRDLYHAREEEDRDVITQKQLEKDTGTHKRTGEQEVLTEVQLKAKRTEEEAEVITEAQLEGDASGVSPREDKPRDVITQKQLDANRTNVEQEVITEKQLDSTDVPWKRAAKKDSSLFKSAGEHLDAVLSALANTVIRTGGTPEEIADVAGSLVSSTKDRYELSKALLEKSNDEDIAYEKRLAFWSGKNIKVASMGRKEIASSIVAELRKVASDATIDTDIIIDALDVISESEEGAVSMSNKVTEKLQSAQKTASKVNKKAELRAALKQTSGKQAREEERKKIEASLDKEEKAVAKEPDTMIETDFKELGCSKGCKEAELRSAIKSFARGALASKNIRLAAITNVTINGDTIQIAVQTDEEGESVEIPIGEQTGPAEEATVPEGDLAGEGLENSLPPAAPAPAAPTGPLASSKNVMKKQAQVPMGGGIPSAPGNVAGGPGAPEQGLPGSTPMTPPVQSLTADDETEVADEIPTAGVKQMPYAICPECGSSNVDIEKEAHGNIEGKCKKCGAEYEALVKKSVEFTIIKPSKSAGEPGAEVPEAPEVPALPVAAQTKIDKNSLVRIASNKEKYGHVCPSCGMSQCKVTASKEGHDEYTCPACGTVTQKDVIVNVNKPDESYLRVRWEVSPDENCEGCRESAKAFASQLKIEKMIKSAANTEFPMANCIERVARKFGGNTVATFGPCKGKALANCICSQLQRVGLRTVRHMEKLASASMQKDPMDECIEDQMKQNFDVKEATHICNCLKKKFASEEDTNIYIQAFKEDVDSGKEKILTAQDLVTIQDITEDDLAADAIVDEPATDVPDIDIGEELPPVEEETVTIEVSEEAAKELAQAVEVAVDQKTESVVEESPAPSVPEMGAPAEVEVSDTQPEAEVINTEEEMNLEAMKTHKLIRVGEEVVKVAATPKKVDSIEGDVKAGVPRAKATLGQEGPDNIDKPMAKPSVPRSTATMGQEGADNINKPASLPDVAVDSAYMGKEKEVQSGMPPINNEIKGTVIAEKSDKVTKEAKQMKEVDSVEGDVEAGVPRAKGTIGNEGKDNVDVPMAKPDVPRGKATMGNEGADNIDKPAKGPDVPVDSAYMGKEKEIQSDMPGINDEMLKKVQQKNEVQLERIAAARRMKAVEVAAKLLATKRITESSYEDVIDSLANFPIDQIAVKAENMYPAKKVVKASAEADTHSLPAIVIESKPQSDQTFAQKLSSQFTIGNRGFDEKLTNYGLK